MMARVNLMVVDYCEVLTNVACALKEDIGDGDVTAALLSPNTECRAVIIARQSCVVAGIPWAVCCFKSINSEVCINSKVNDGAQVEHGETIMTITGNARDILTAERTALNFLQTLSAVATKTAHYIHLIKQSSTTLLDTRKTIPGLRYAQKYAVTCGGGSNHRMGLYDAYLIKENHIKACGSIKAAIEKARLNNENKLVEIEVESLDEFKQALRYEPDVIMLDNFELNDIATAIDLRGSADSKIEVSGGINDDTIQSISQLGVDYISVGNLTKSVDAVDLSLLIEEGS